MRRGGDGYDVEAIRAHGQGLDEPVGDAVVGGHSLDGGVADVMSSRATQSVTLRVTAVKRSHQVGPRGGRLV